MQPFGGSVINVAYRTVGIVGLEKHSVFAQHLQCLDGLAVLLTEDDRTKRTGNTQSPQLFGLLW